MIARAAWPLLCVVALAGCAPRIDPRVPPFATKPYAPFSRTAAVAIALREWRLFGAPIDDDPPGTRPPPLPDAKPERVQGLWQRVGEYWYEGLDQDAPESRWTGKHDGNGAEFPAADDGAYAWSAAFISYVMRIAGAGPAFPYAADHAIYINIAMQMRRGLARGYALVAEPPNEYAPRPGDLICTGRGSAAGITYAALPAGIFPAHCDIVVAATPGQLSVIGGNVDDAVTLKHVPVAPDGKLADARGVIDPRYPWFVVVRILYAA